MLKGFELLAENKMIPFTNKNFLDTDIHSFLIHF